MSLSVEQIFKKRENVQAVRCVKNKCEGVDNQEVGFHTRMWWCRKHRWKEMVAGAH